MTLDIHTTRKAPDSRIFILQAAVLGTAALFVLTGCSSKNYVRSQTAPIIQQTNELDAKTAVDHRNIVDTDERAQKGIAGAMDAANTADQHAVAAGTSADGAQKNAQDAYNRVDSLTGVVANLDNYKPLSDVSVTFAFDKYALTKADREQLDSFASTLTTARGYILEVTGGTDSTGDAQYNYQLSQRRADAVVNYLSGKHNVPPHKFYLVGIGKDVQVASDRTAAGRAKNRRVEIKLMSNMSSSVASAPAPNGQE
ncbi:OmpA family protein [Granulicella arctica]|uniref:Outer membrane protein OmpA-like peptidoglycan-associated protein n=1 Tax=Granulicella arctica TaxID=940613 RepID=A0A7Y9PJJ9_9BACT|nr:OmpA family protein [Granulicella arctica]NYF81031.1 outer membrane protein OmpA-like peptidoglycan-associated protein [Granulicella arctica]